MAASLGQSEILECNTSFWKDCQNLISGVWDIRWPTDKQMNDALQYTGGMRGDLKKKGWSPLHLKDTYMSLQEV